MASTTTTMSAVFHAAAHHAGGSVVMFSSDDSEPPSNCTCATAVTKDKDISNAQAALGQAAAESTAGSSTAAAGDVQVYPYTARSVSDGPSNMVHASVATTRGEVLVTAPSKGRFDKSSVPRFCIGDQVVAHSCDANAVVINDTIIALTTIPAQALVTVNYNLMAWQYPDRLICNCGAAECDGFVGGFEIVQPARQQQWLYLTENGARREAWTKGHVFPKSTNPKVDIRPFGALGLCAFAKTDIPVGERIYRCQGLTIPFPTVFTICLAANKHLYFSADAQCMAHSCNPNGKIVVGEDYCDHIAIRPIRAGDSISFNYLTTEWNMDAPFECGCQESGCFGMIAGFGVLPTEAKARLEEQASPWVRDCHLNASNF